MLPELIKEGSLKTGDQVALNEGFVVIAKLPLPDHGPIARISGKLQGGQWLVQAASGNTETIAVTHADLDAANLKEGEEVFLDANQKVILGKLAKRESKLLAEDDFEQVEWSQVGGQEKVKEEIRKVLEYPLLHENILKEMEYQVPKVFLFYRPPGCGKTLVGRAILTEVIKNLSEQEKSELEGRFIQGLSLIHI